MAEGHTDITNTSVLLLVLHVSLFVEVGMFFKERVGKKEEENNHFFFLITLLKLIEMFIFYIQIQNSNLINMA